MRRPRVLMFCEQYFPLVGGAERQAQKLAESLIARDCDVEVVTPLHERHWPTEETLNGVSISRFPILDLSKAVRFRGIGVPNTALLRYQVRKRIAGGMRDADILHAHMGSLLSIFAMEAAQSVGRSAICKIASGGRMFDLRRTERTSLLGPSLVQRAVHQMDRWIAISAEIANDLKAWGISPSRIVRIPNGVAIPVALPNKRAEVARRFLYLGRLCEDRDFETLIRAFDVVARAYPDCELRLVGGGEGEAQVRGLLENLEHARRATQLVGFDEPTQWLRWADVVVQPSLVEGISNTLLEAMAYEVCCVANDIPPNREVLAEGQAGILVPVADVGALADVLLRLAATRGASLMWGGKGRQRVMSEYSMESIADRYLQFYGELLAERSKKP